MEYSKLIEPNVRTYLNCTLQSCRETRTNVYYLALNLGILALFIVVFGSALYYCYKQKKSPYEIQEKMIKDQEYILSKIRFYQSSKQVETTSKISNLPSMTNSFD
jgi:hypothetical protein